jgi:proteic killer suppression protein
MIRSFADTDTEAVFEGRRPRRMPSDILRRAQRKLVQVHTVTRLEDLRVPPGNRLEALTGNRSGRHSIRVNQQWRITFRWEGGDAHEVLIEDYHRG